MAVVQVAVQVAVAVAAMWKTWYGDDADTPFYGAHKNVIELLSALEPKSVRERKTLAFRSAYGAVYCSHLQFNTASLQICPTLTYK